MRAEGSEKMHQREVLTHGLQHVARVPFEDRVTHMSCSQGAGGFVSLHRSGRVRFYRPDGHLTEPAVHSTVSYTGITYTQIPGRLVGWGPGASLTLLDGDLVPLVHAQEPLDIRVCQVLEGSQELVTAGAENLCVWCAGHLVCRVRVQEGFERGRVFTRLALVPGAAHRASRALAACGGSITVVDLSEGRVLGHRTNLHPRKITAVVYCSLQDVVATASKDVNIRIWGSNWELLMSFVGHTAAVTSLLWCPASGLLLSSSLDTTLRSWSLETGDLVQVVTPPSGNAPLFSAGGPSLDSAFFSFSESGVDFWTFNSLYRLHCKLHSPVRQISAPPSDPPYPARILCVHGDGDISLISAGTGAVLTSFRSDRRTRCADYCLHKEVLLVLTDEGTLIRGNTLTNPVTRLAEGCEESAGESGRGRACCMALYSHIAAPETALEGWRELQEERGVKTRRRRMEEENNSFLVMLGHRGGYISVMQMHSGKVQSRISTHNNQDVISIRAYPDNNCMLTAGEDGSVLVWNVCPYMQECVSVQKSVFCSHSPVCVSLLDSTLAVGLQHEHSATYSVVQYRLQEHTPVHYHHPPEHDHCAALTGLCVSQTLGGFVSCTRDGTVRIWDEENKLLRTLDLCAEPECVEFNGSRSELLLGISGNIYKIHLTPLLPPEYQLQILLNEEPSDPVPDLPIPYTSTTSCTQRSESSCFSEVTWTERQEVTKHPELECLLERNRDLSSLQNGNTHSKRKLTSTVNTRREAFTRYLQLLYHQPADIHIPEEDPFDLHAVLIPPKSAKLRPLTPPTLESGFFSTYSRSEKPDTADLQETGPPCTPQTPPGFVPNSTLAGQLWPDVGARDTEEKNLDEEQISLRTTEETPLVDSPARIIQTPTESDRSRPSSATPPPLSPTDTLKPFKPLPPIKETPPTRQQTPPPTPPKPVPVPSTLTRSPSPQLPQFLHQFLQEQWFHNIYPDLRCISESLSPSEFCSHLLDFLKRCIMDEKLRVLRAVVTLYTHNLLTNTHTITHTLLELLHTCLHTHMSDTEQCLVVELLNVLVCLDPHSSDVTSELLSLLADKRLRLQGVVVCMLQAVGLDDVQRWLGPQLESWYSTAQKHMDPQSHLREAVRNWLHIWTSKYKMHKRSGEKSVISAAEVVRYFCQVQAKPPAPPPDRKETGLMDPKSNRWKMLQRLNETNSMTPTREPRALWLPPLASRPLLMGFTRALSLPMPRVTTSSFPFTLEVHCLRRTPLQQRYFHLERSYVHYYR